MNRIKTGYILNYILTILLCVIAIPANAQRDDWKELCEKNQQLEKDINSLIADTITLHQTIEKFDAEQLRLNEQIDSFAIKLNGLKEDVDNKNVASIQYKVDSLKAVIMKLQDRKKDLDSINNQKETTLFNLKRNISGMGAFSAIKDEQMYSQYQEILLRPYSSISIETLSEIDSKLNSFSELQGFTEFNVRLNACKKNKELYDVAEGLLHSALDAEKIDSTRNKLFELLDIKKNDFRKGIIKLSDAQYSEIDTLDIKLSRYGDGIALLQGIVKAVNDSQVREQYKGNKVPCVEAMRSIVISDVAEDKEKRQRYFDMIPSLNALYKKYWKELQADPFSYPTKSEILILQLNNE